jgi:DNA modification methylase/uncharacterized protein (DUF433 family)
MPLASDEYDALRSSIESDGLLVPIDVDSDGAILDGHHRYMAAKEAGVEIKTRLVPGYETEDEKIAYVIRCNLQRRNLSPDAKSAIRKRQQDIACRLRDVNPQRWTQEALARLLGVGHQRISEWTSTSIAETGKACIDARVKVPAAAAPIIVERLANGEPQEQVAADFGVTQQRVSQIAAKHEKRAAKEKAEAIAAANARKKADAPVIRRCHYRDFLTALDEASADLLLTDPPYSTDVEDLESFVSDWVPLALSRLKPTGRAYIFCGSYPNELLTYISCIARQDAFAFGNVLVWSYDNTIGPAPAHDYKTNWQACMHLRGAAAPRLECPELRELFAARKVTAPDARHGTRHHTWEKPVELLEAYIRHSTSPGQLVIDCFAGSGSTLVAAKNTGRIGIGCDIDAASVSTAVKRGCRRDA